MYKRQGFKEDTVWFNKCLDSWDGVPKLTFDPENKWFKTHIQLAKDCQALAGDDFYVDMPDLMENIDVLASLRGAQDILFDLLDEPEMIGERIQEVTDIYYEYYDRFYDIIKDEEGGNAYTVFQSWGPGRTVTVSYTHLVLKKTAECISGCTSEGQKVYKLVADEFLILDVASDEAKDADKLYDKVREAIDRFIETNEFKVMYTVSGGIVPFAALKGNQCSRCV